MTGAHRDVAPMLGAWAVGACSPEEATLVEQHLAECPECARESRLLTNTDGVLRRRVLGAALGRRAAAPAVPGYAAAFAAQISVLDVLLAELDDSDWATLVIYDWNVQAVVAHLSATDRLLAEQLDPDRPREGDIDAYTAEAIAFEREHRPEETRANWHKRARALCGLLTEADAGRRVSMRYPLRLDNAIIARAFETWVHSSDIAKAVGRSLPAPLPRHLHDIADLGVRVLPFALAMRGLQAAGRAKVVLDGPGGGEWLVTLGGDGAAAPAVTLRLDTLEFCMLAADRRDPDKIEATISGDPTLARHLLHSASAFAGP